MQISAIMRKFVDNLNNFCNFIGRHQTLKMHIQGKSADTNFSCCGAGHRQQKPPDSHKAIGGNVTGKSHFDFSMLVFSADFPTDTKLRRKRPKTANAAAVIQSSGGGGIFLITKSKHGFPVTALAIFLQNTLKSHILR